ncbi:family 20 glycosylhydrolase [Belliella pelovolcani]|uniref:beta-N-acetylhexosaminidase n=1 Tax=Belliella pelovolcani TaxID=529505 RepID=A0A1N7ND32_9BACT|nr:family 20 glycosylhydrolase [Belliella pelovolcani]SIS96099.1 Glycosyl hydrolase family 20, domain 2 [Belliella pelovolcani]
MDSIKSPIWAFLILLLIAHFKAFGQSEKLLPQPYQASFGNAELIIKGDKEDFKSKLTEWISVPRDGSYNFEDVQVSVQWVEKLNGIDFNKDESYLLEVTAEQIAIQAVKEQGAFYALQTLLQLADEKEGNLVIPESRILDRPAFRIRGFMHDVGRSFIPVEELMKQIEILSSYKINVFHWHFTEDLAWRLESRLFPELTADENFERFPGEYYTQEDVRKLLDFAKRHHVTVIPEIDLPGHSAAFQRAFGYDMQSKEGKEVLKALLTEAGDLFAGLPYFHIGTDEVRFTDPDFVPEMVAFVRAMGFKVVSWNPGWDYKAGEIDMLQLWSYRGKAPEGIPFVDSRFHYINHFDAFADLVSLFRSNVAGYDIGSEAVAGSILAIWNDRKLNDWKLIIRENNFYPAMLTFAERLWQGGGEGYFDEIGVLLPQPSTPAWESFADFEDRLLWQRDHQFENSDFPYYKQRDMEWLVLPPLANQGNLDLEFDFEADLKKGQVPTEMLAEAIHVKGGGTYLRHVWGNLVPAAIKDPKPNHTAFVIGKVYATEDKEVKAVIVFQDYSRSEKDLPPPQGAWDWKGSKAWINGEPILAPIWENSHTDKTNEIPLQNENWQSRPAQRLTLKKGWNMILLKLPVGQFQTKELRLVKWMWNFVILDKDGQEAESLKWDNSKIESK